MSDGPSSASADRGGPRRDRRGRGARGPMSLTGPLTPKGIPAHRSGRTWFDESVAEIYDRICEGFTSEAACTELVIEEAPVLPENWDEPVPSSALKLQRAGHPRIIVYRLPIVARLPRADEILEAVWAVLLHRLSEAWQVPAHDLDPR